MAKPTIVFVPGAWHIPEHYAPIITRLRDSGYEVVQLRHPSCTVTSDPGNMMQEDATFVANTIRQVVESGKDVMVLMHSYGGITGPEGTAIVLEEQKGRQGGKEGMVKRLVFLAAHILEKGMSLNGSGNIIPGIEYLENGMMEHQYPKERYYNDLSAEEAKLSLDMLVPMAASAFTTPTRYAGWRDYGIPCSYVKCLKDQAVTTKHWDIYIPRAKDAGVDMDVVELDASHSPFLSKPDALLEVLLKCIS